MSDAFRYVDTKGDECLRLAEMLLQGSFGVMAEWGERESVLPPPLPAGRTLALPRSKQGFPRYPGIRPCPE